MFATLSKSHSRLTVACKQPVRYYRNIVKLFSDRGLLQDVFPKEKVSNLVQMIEKKSVGVYAGFDPTADSLHIGNLLVLMGLLHAQRSGLKPVAVIGGATGRIGDPSGKSSERPVLASETLDNNIKGVRTDIQKIFSNHEKYLWHSDKLLEPVTIAYDWLRLCKEYECYIQLGGSDQMGNIVSGQDLISRKLEKSVYGVTMPLVVSESGDKFGKSSGTPVWINELKTTPYEVYQYMLRQKDSDIQKMLKLFTFLPLPEVEAIVNKHEAKPEARYGQERLAEQITLLLHGPAGLKLAESSTQIFFKNDINALAKLSTDESRAVFQQADYIQKLFSPGITVYDFALSIGCFKWDRDALRIIAGGGFYINQVKITNPDEVLVHGIHILENDLTLVRVGKIHYYLVEWVNS